MMRTCKRCGETKDIEQFSRHGGKHTGHRHVCRKCKRGFASAWRKQDYEANPDKYRDRGILQYRETPRVTLRHALFNAVRRRPNADSVTLAQLMEMFFRQNGKCALSGIPMTWASGQGRPMPTSISLDRIDQKRDYTHDNVRLVCNAINNFRGTMSDDELRAMLQAFHTFQFPADGLWGGVLSEAA